MTQIKPTAGQTTPRFADIATFFRLPIVKDLNKLDYFIKENIIFKKEDSYILSEKGKLFANEVANNFVK